MVTAPAATINTIVPMPMWTAIWEINVPLILQALTIFKLILEPQAASNAALNGDRLLLIFDSGRLVQELSGGVITKDAAHAPGAFLQERPGFLSTLNRSNVYVNPSPRIHDGCTGFFSMSCKTPFR